MHWIFPQTSRGSFSAASTPIFASKYALERRDLHNALLCTVLQSQNFSQKSSTFFRECTMNFRFFHFLHRILHFFCEFLMKIYPDFATNSINEWHVSLSQSNLRKQTRRLPKILNSVKIIHYYSIWFIRVITPEGTRCETAVPKRSATLWGSRSFCPQTRSDTSSTCRCAGRWPS